MKSVFAYVRVSTPKQGEGVSLTAQRDAITRYAATYELDIVDWFEELQTAAKRGRPVFTKMLRLLNARKATGVIIHKIDRSARNLKDWADLGELIDGGVDVHFANESLDLHSRGGRLSADIQAVVAADYIRNLREETRKGFYGRIKQGFFPLPAPIGYLDRGTARAKEPDPVRAPLVREAFELYASKGYTLHTLRAELHRLGLRTRRGGRLSVNSLSVLLNNPFYLGLIRLQKTGEMFPGNHEALISKALFERVHSILTGRTNTKVQRHPFLFRRLIKCRTCAYSLIGERQKGHAYYRCHSANCERPCVREELIDEAAAVALRPLELTDAERSYIKTKVAALTTRWAEDHDRRLEGLKLALSQLDDRLTRLTDAFVDGLLDKLAFEQRRAALLVGRKGIEEALAAADAGTVSIPAAVAKYLELAGRSYLGYKLGLPTEKREFLEIVTSNRWADGKQVVFERTFLFEEIAARWKNTNGRPSRDIPRTWDPLVERLSGWLTAHPECLTSRWPVQIATPE